MLNFSYQDASTSERLNGVHGVTSSPSKRTAPQSASDPSQVPTTAPAGSSGLESSLPMDKNALTRLAEIRQRHRCAKHDSVCIVSQDGKHYALSYQILCDWVHLVVRSSYDACDHRY